MMTTCLRAGWRAAASRPRLIATLWLWNLLLALVVGWGMSRWLGAAFNYSPEANLALERFRFGLLIELTQYDRFSPFTVLGGVVMALLVLAAASNALIAAGVLEVLVSGDDRPLLHRFFRGAGHFFGRFLRLALITAFAALLALGIVGAITSPVTRALGESSWERTWIAAGLARWLIFGAMVATAMVILDVARTRVCTAQTEIRGMLRAWAGAVRFVFGHAARMAGIYVVMGGCWLLASLIGLALVFAVPATSWATILLLILVQQAFMIARATIRVARAGAVIEAVGPALTVGYPVESPGVPNVVRLDPGAAEPQPETPYADEVTGSTPRP